MNLMASQCMLYVKCYIITYNSTLRDVEKTSPKLHSFSWHEELTCMWGDHKGPGPAEYLSLTTGHLSLTTGHLSLTMGHLSLTMGHNRSHKWSLCAGGSWSTERRQKRQLYASAVMSMNWVENFQIASFSRIQQWWEWKERFIKTLYFPPTDEGNRLIIIFFLETTK